MLGAGGMGVVYHARDPDLERDVAIKLLRTPAGGGTAPGDPHPELRLLREARAMAKLVHPNLVTVFDVGTYEGRVFVAMEYVEGQTFKQWVNNENPPWRQRLEVLIAAGRGIAKAHAAGVVHRDLKPDNILVERSGAARVADFGLARHAGEEEEAVPDRGTHAAPRDPLTAQLTSTGALLGTPAYMSPEQFLGKPADFRSDQFSFAVVVYWALWGRRPFEGDRVDALAASILMGRVAAPPEDSPVPRAVFAVIERALRTRPEERYDSVEQFLDALGRATSESRSGRTLILAGAAAVTILLVAGALFTITRTRASDQPAPAEPRAESRDVEAVAERAAAAIERAEELIEKKTQLRARHEEARARAARELAERALAERVRAELPERLVPDLPEVPDVPDVPQVPDVLAFAEEGDLLVVHVAEKHKPELDKCMREVADAGLAPPSGLVMELELDATGHVTRWSTPLPGAGARALAECIGKAGRAWQFPRPRSGRPTSATLVLELEDP